MPCFCAKMAMMPRWSSVAAPAESSTSNQSSQLLPVRRATASVLTPAASLMLLRAGFLTGGSTAGVSAFGAGFTALPLGATGLAPLEAVALVGAAVTAAGLALRAIATLALSGAFLVPFGASLPRERARAAAS